MDDAGWDRVVSLADPRERKQTRHSPGYDRERFALDLERYRNSHNLDTDTKNPPKNPETDVLSIENDEEIFITEIVLKPVSRKRRATPRLVASASEPETKALRTENSGKDRGDEGVEKAEDGGEAKELSRDDLESARILSNLSQTSIPSQDPTAPTMDAYPDHLSMVSKNPPKDPQTRLDTYFPLQGSWFAPLKPDDRAIDETKDVVNRNRKHERSTVTSAAGRPRDLSCDVNASSLTGESLDRLKKHGTLRPETFMRKGFRLRPHQFEALSFCYRRCVSETPSFLIGDDTGTGKTALSLCIVNAMPEPDEEDLGIEGVPQLRALVVGTLESLSTYRTQIQKHCVSEMMRDDDGVLGSKDLLDEFMDDGGDAPPETAPRSRRSGRAATKKSKKKTVSRSRKTREEKPRDGKDDIEDEDEDYNPTTSPPSPKKKKKKKASKKASTRDFFVAFPKGSVNAGRKTSESEEEEGEEEGAPMRRQPKTLFVGGSRDRIDLEEASNADLIFVTYQTLSRVLKNFLEDSEATPAARSFREAVVSGRVGRISGADRHLPLEYVWRRSKSLKPESEEGVADPFEREPVLRLFFGALWGTVILDEGHHVRNPGNRTTEAARSLAALRRGLMTATPAMNNMTEFMELMRFLAVPELKDIKDLSTLRKEICERKGDPDSPAVGLVTKLMDKYMIRRLKNQLSDGDDGMCLPTLYRWIYSREMSREVRELYSFIAEEMDTLDRGIDAQRRKTKDMNEKQRQDFTKRLLEQHKRRLEAKGKSLDGVGSPPMPSDVEETREGERARERVVREVKRRMIERSRELARSANSMHTLWDNQLMRLQQVLSVPGVLDPELLTHPCYTTHCPKANMAVDFIRSRVERKEGYDPKLLATIDDEGTELDRPAVLEFCERLQHKEVKVIFFFLLVESMKVISKRLEMEDIPHLMIHGKTPQRRREEIKAEFADPVGPRVLLVAFGCMSESWDGTAANRSVIFDQQFNPAKDKQGPEGRICRLGSDPYFACHVTRLIMRHTREENILKMGQTKRKEIEALDTRRWSDVGNAGINSFTRERNERDEIVNRFFDYDPEIEKLRDLVQDYAASTSRTLPHPRTARRDPFDQFRDHHEEWNGNGKQEQDGRRTEEENTVDEDAEKEGDTNIDLELERLAQAFEAVRLRKQIRDAREKVGEIQVAVLRELSNVLHGLAKGSDGDVEIVEEPTDELCRYAIEVRTHSPTFRQGGIKGLWLFSESHHLATETPDHIGILRASSAIVSPSEDRETLRILDLSSLRNKGLKTFAKACTSALSAVYDIGRAMNVHQKNAHQRSVETKPCSEWIWVLEAWGQSLAAQGFLGEATSPSSSSSTISPSTSVFAKADQQETKSLLQNLVFASACCVQTGEKGREAFPMDGLKLRLPVRSGWLDTTFFFRPHDHVALDEGFAMYYPSRAPLVLGYFSDPSRVMKEHI